jgi:hypothetical protein
MCHRVCALALAASSFLGLSCVQSLGPGSPEAIFTQLPGCRSSAGKPAFADSCFSWAFHGALILDFCVTANCCPDTNRFALTHTIVRDTLILEVADTTSDLCRCVCPYLLHSEFPYLEGDSYLILCLLEGDTLYTRRVSRE